MSTQQSGLDYVVDYLRKRRPDLGEIPTDLDLIENRILDSLGFVNFIYLLEEHSGQEISMDRVTPEDFRTIEAIDRRFFQ